jgi:hypothetical protein
MLHKQTEEKTDNATLAGVMEEMAKPRMAASARAAELHLDTERIPEQPSVTLPGTVDKIISSPSPSQPEKAQITVEGADRGHRDLRIENVLTGENGDNVRLKKGAHVEVTVAAEPGTPTTPTGEAGNLTAEIPPDHSPMSPAERSLYLKDFRMISCAHPVDAPD